MTRPGAVPAGIDPFAPPRRRSAVPRPRPAPPPVPPVPPPRRRRRRRRPVVVLAAALMVVASGAALTVLGDGSPSPVPAPEGTRTVRTEVLAYQVPARWDLTRPGPAPAALGIALHGLAVGPHYSCGGTTAYRAAVGSRFVSRRGGQDAGTERAAREFGRAFVATFYGAGARVDGQAVRPVDDGAGTLAELTVVTGAAEGCRASRGRVVVLALASPRRGPAGGRGVVILVLRHDLAGGPPSPAPVPEWTVRRILDSARLPAG